MISNREDSKLIVAAMKAGATDYIPKTASSEELWEKIGNKFSIHQQKWPKYDENLIEEEVVTIGIMVNGKLRGTIEVQISNDKHQFKFKNQNHFVICNLNFFCDLLYYFVN